MKKLIFLSAITLGLFSCKEIPLAADKEVKVVLLDTTYMESVEVPQLKNVLVEKSTGVNCNNCPKGDNAIKSLQGLHPNRLVPVGLHNGQLADPHSSDQGDFKSPYSEDIVTFFGFQGQPSAAINRGKYGTNPLLLALPVWTTYVDTQLAKVPPVNLYLEGITFDAATRKVKYTVTAKYTQEVSEAVNLSIMVIEDSLRSIQKLPAGDYDSSYVQMHVLRTMFTPSLGSPFTSPDKKPGRVVKREYESTLPANLEAKHCKLVAFLHYSSATNTEVLQVVEKELE